MAGRPPKPTALKVLHGDAKERINHREPKPRVSADVTEPPRALTGRGLEVWGELAPSMAATQVLTDWDRDLLAAFCEAVHFRAEAAAALEGGGVMNGRVKNPAMQVWRDATSAMVQLGAQLGLSPAARTKISTGEATSAKKADRLLS